MGLACEFIKTHDWCQRALARDAEGKGCYPSESEAVSFCALGAIRGAYQDSLEGETAWMKLLEHLRSKGIINEYSGIPTWNDADGRTKEEIVHEMCEAGI